MGTNSLPSNAGLRVGFELPPKSGGASTAILYGDAIAYEIRGAAQTKPRLGRGDTVSFPTHRAISGSRNGVATVTVLASIAPVPDDWRGKTCTLRVYYDGERYDSSTVKITGFDLKRSEKTGNDQTATISWVNEGAEAYTYPDTNTGGTAESVATQQQLEGTVKGYDPKGISPPPTQVTIDWVSTLDNTVAGADAAEQTYLLAQVAAAVVPFTSPHSYKLRGTTFTRYAINGGTIIHSWGLTDTAEDTENEGTYTNTDPQKISTGGVVAKINNTDPTIPTVAGNTLVSRGITKTEINDSKILYKNEFGQRSTKDDEEMPVSFTEEDPLGLDSKEADAVVFSTLSGPPTPSANGTLANTTLVSQRLDEINLDESKSVANYGPRTSAEEIGFAEEQTKDDASNIDDYAVRWKIWDTSGDAPAAPDNPPADNVKLIHVLDRPKIRAAFGGETISIRFFIYGPKSSRDEKVLEHYETTQDASDLTSTAIRAYLDGESVPAAPTVGGLTLVLRDTKTFPLSFGLGTNRTLTVLIFGVRTHKADVEQEGTKYEVDQSGNIVGGSARVTVVEADSTPDGGVTVSGLVLRDIEKKQNGQKWDITYVFGQNTPEQDILFEGTHYDLDKSGLDSASHITLINGSTTYPSALDTGPTVGGTVLTLIDVITRPLTTGSGKYAHRGIYSLVTNQQKLEYQHTTGEGDPQGSDPSVTASVVSSSGASAQTLASAYLNANTDPLLLGVDFKTLTPAKALRILKTARDDKQLVGSGSVHEERVNGIPQDALASTTHFDPSLIDFTSGDAVGKCVRLYTSTVGLMIPVAIQRATGMYELTRYVLTDTMSDVFHSALIGTVNDAAFYTFPAHTLKFAPPEIIYNVAIASGHRIAKVKFRLLYDNWLHFSDANLPSGEVLFSTTVSSPGWVNPLHSFLTGGVFFKIVWPDDEDFSPLLA